MLNDLMGKPGCILDAMREVERLKDSKPTGLDNLRRVVADLRESVAKAKDEDRVCETDIISFMKVALGESPTRFAADHLIVAGFEKRVEAVEGVCKGGKGRRNVVNLEKVLDFLKILHERAIVEVTSRARPMEFVGIV